MSQVQPAGWVGEKGPWIAALFVTAAALLSVPAAAQQTVTTTTGTFTSVPSPYATGVEVFYGMRYAAPPSGQLRWLPPQPPTPPAGTVLASTPGPACPQSYDTTPLTQSEDCLSLNVYIPASATPQSRLPVFFWIHGGSLILGAGAFYDPSVMVAGSDIIAVSINYRLGALGWLVEPGLAAAAPNGFQTIGDAGNYGLMDQQFALRWVQSNIAGFGGDPAKVTIAGESAGGLSVLSNLASPVTGRGLFRGAIVESGAYQLHQVPSQAIYQSLFGAAFAGALGCSTDAAPNCLRNQPVADILTAQDSAYGSAGIAPVFGTLILPEPLDTAFATGAFNRVPVLQGTNANEGRTFEPDFIAANGTLDQVAASGGPANYDLSHASNLCGGSSCSYPREIQAYLAELGTFLGVSTKVDTPEFNALIATQYPLPAYPDPYLPNNAPSADEALSQIYTDLSFTCNGWDANRELSRFVPVYAYEFNDPLAPPEAGILIAPPNDVLGFPTASEHASELLSLFTLVPAYDPTLTAGELQLAAQMKCYWANFVIGRNPNGNGATQLPSWPRFNLLPSQRRAAGSRLPVPDNTVLALVPGPQLPYPFTSFRQEHFCDTWEPVLLAEPPL